MSLERWTFPLSEAKWNQSKSAMPIGIEVTGTIVAAMAFGVFVKTEVPALCIVDIGNPGVGDGASRLPRDYALWPTVGESIRGRVLGFRENNYQIELEWLPKETIPESHH